MVKCIGADEEDVEAMEVRRDAKAHKKLHHERYKHDNEDIKAFHICIPYFDQNSSLCLLQGGDQANKCNQKHEESYNSVVHETT